MAAGSTIIDVDDYPELSRLANQVEDSGNEITLRRGARTIARIVPVDPTYDELHPTNWKLTEDQEDALKRAAGSWKGLIEADEFLKLNYASRDRSAGRPVD